MDLKKIKNKLKSLVEAAEDFQEKRKEYQDCVYDLTEKDLKALKEDEEYLALAGRLFLVTINEN